MFRSSDMHLIGLFDSIKVGRTEALVSYSADDLINIRNDAGNTVLHIAVENGHLKLLDKIKSICPRLYSIRNNEGLTPTGLACRVGKLRILQWAVINSPEPVLNYKSNIEDDIEYPNMIQISVIYNQPECCLWLCSEYERRQFSLDIQNSKDESLLHLAAKYDSLHCLQILVSAGTRINLKNSNNQTAAQIAHESNNKLILGQELNTI